MIEIFSKLKLKHSDPVVRLEAVKQLPKNSPEFFEIANTDSDENVRAEATAGVRDLEQLEGLLEKESSERILKYLHRKLDKIYLKKLEKCHDTEEAVALASKLSGDQEHLAAAASHTVDCAAALSIAKRVTEPKALLKIFRNSHSRQLCDELLLDIDDLKMLGKIAHSAAIITVKHDAEDRIKELNPKEIPTKEESTEKVSAYKQEINLRHELTEMMEKTVHNISHSATDGFDKLMEKWHKLPLPGDSMAEILEKRFKEAASLCRDKINETRKNAKKLDQFKDQLQSMFNEAEKLVFAPDNWRYVQEKTEKLKGQWHKLTADLKDTDQMNEKFTTKITELEQQAADYQEQIRVARESFKESCHQLEKLVETNTPDAVKDQINELRNKAKEAQQFLLNAKAVPRRIADRFQRVEKQFRGQLYQAYQARDFGRWEHYTLKLDICTEMEKMQGSDNFKKIGKKLSSLRRKWYELGAVPHEKAEEIQARFDALYTALRTRCDEFFEKYKEKQLLSVDIKKALCEKAEELQNSEEWHKVADSFKELQQKWKENIPAPRDIEQELYKRFRSACDTFFNRRKAHYGELKKVRSSIIEIKSKICEQAEALIENGTPSDVGTVKQMRRKWREAGRAGKAEISLNQRFNDALDKFFDRLNESRKGVIEESQAVCDLLKELVEGKLDADSPIKFREINAKWRELPMVPGRDASIIEKHFRDFTDTYHKQMESIEFEIYLNELKKLKKFEMNIAKLTEAPADDFQDVEELPKASRKPAAKFIQSLQADPESEKLKKKLDLNFEKRQEVCLKVEKMCGLASPETPVSLAEELQAAILGNALTPVKEKTDPVKEFKSLRKNWDSLSPAAYPTEAPSLYKRYIAACKAVAEQN